MLKSIHEESSTVTALCSAVDSCLSLGEWGCLPKKLCEFQTVFCQELETHANLFLLFLFFFCERK